jgi:hypothetical protein
MVSLPVDAGHGKHPERREDGCFASLSMTARVFPDKTASDTRLRPAESKLVSAESKAFNPLGCFKTLIWKWRNGRASVFFIITEFQ